MYKDQRTTITRGQQKDRSTSQSDGTEDDGDLKLEKNDGSSFDETRIRRSDGTLSLDSTRTDGRIHTHSLSTRDGDETTVCNGWDSVETIRAGNSKKRKKRHQQPFALKRKRRSSNERLGAVKYMERRADTTWKTWMKQTANMPELTKKSW